MKVINPAWLAEQESKIIQERSIDEVLSSALAQRALVSLLARFGKSFRVINLSCGVKRIATNVDICPKCNGTGRC